MRLERKEQKNRRGIDAHEKSKQTAAAVGKEAESPLFHPRLGSWCFCRREAPEEQTPGIEARNILR